jgi:hypothetical protein
MIMDNQADAPDCRLAVERLLAATAGTNVPRSEVDAAIRHVLECPVCGDRLGYLVRAIESPDEDRLTCSQCEAALPHYVRAEAEGCAGDSEWQPVQLHLEVCAHCAEHYSRLAAADAFQDRPATLPEDTVLHDAMKVPAPPSEHASRGWQVAVGFRWMVAAAGRLLVQVAAESMGPIVAPTVLAATRGTEEPDRRDDLWHIVLTPQETGDLDVEAIVRRDPQRADTCRLSVQVQTRSRWPDLAGVRVIARAGDWHAEGLTDDGGQVILAGLLSARLRDLEIEVAW